MIDKSGHEAVFLAIRGFHCLTAAVRAAMPSGSGSAPQPSRDPPLVTPLELEADQDKGGQY